MNQETECDCGLNNDAFMCIEGRIYGPCDDIRCGGVCELVGKCECECHRLVAKQPDT